MTDFETVAIAEERSWALAELKDLVDEYGPIECQDGALRFPVSEGEEQWKS